MLWIARSQAEYCTDQDDLDRDSPTASSPQRQRWRRQFVAARSSVMLDNSFIAIIGHPTELMVISSVTPEAEGKNITKGLGEVKEGLREANARRKEIGSTSALNSVNYFADGVQLDPFASSDNFPCAMSGEAGRADSVLSSA